MSALKERRGFVVLSVICIFSCIVAILISTENAKSETRKFCQVLVVQVHFPPPKPPNLVAHTEAVERWLVYTRRVEVFHELGC